MNPRVWLLCNVIDCSHVDQLDVVTLVALAACNLHVIIAASLVLLLFYAWLNWKEYRRTGQFWWLEDAKRGCHIFREARRLIGLRVRAGELRLLAREMWLLQRETAKANTEVLLNNVPGLADVFPTRPCAYGCGTAIWIGGACNVCAWYKTTRPGVLLPIVYKRARLVLLAQKRKEDGNAFGTLPTDLTVWFVRRYVLVDE